MITLDGYTYYVKADAHKPSLVKDGETKLSINESIIRTGTTKVLNKWNYTILCSLTHIGSIGGLDTLMETRKRGGALTLIDENEITYNQPGVYIEVMGAFTNLGPILSTTNYSVDIQLVCGKIYDSP